jgi:DNA adenine methylase
MREVSTTKSRGERKLFFEDACKSRYNRQKKRVLSVSQENNKPVKPLLKYPGAKWQRSQWIIGQLPKFRTYVEPFFGSGAIFFSLPECPEYAVLNDMSKSVVNLFEVVRTRGPELCAMVELTPWSRDEYYASYELTGDPLEDARRFLVRCWQAFGTRLNQRTGWRNRGSADGGLTYTLWNQLPERISVIIERLKYAEIENRPALEIIERFLDQEDALIYCDPPYVLDTRGGRKLYEAEMTDADHCVLLDALERHSGPVVLSGYAHPLYDERLKTWQRITRAALAERGQTRTEVLWLNAKAQHKQMGLFEQVEGA